MRRQKKVGNKTRPSTAGSDDAVEKFFDDKSGNNKFITIGKIFELLEDMGIFPMTDPRMKDFMQFINTKGDKLTKNDFLLAASLGDGFIIRAIRGEMVIKNFPEFREVLAYIYDISKLENRGKVSETTPYLASQATDVWEMGLYSISNRIARLGKTQVKFTMQACIRPLMFALAIEILGIDTVLKYVGMEFHSGFTDDINSLNNRGVPRNPIINSGAITLCSYIRNEGLKHLTKAELFDYILGYLRDLAGGKYVNFSNTAYMSERSTENKNRAIIQFLRMKKCIPENTNIEADFDFYTLTCSFEVTVESLSVIGATLANFGVNPLTGKEVLMVETSKQTLSMMNYCSPTCSWPRDVGLPAVKGASGCLILICPGVFAISLYSPKVDKFRTSVKAETFCLALVEQYLLHPYDDYRSLELSIIEDNRVEVSKPCSSHCFLFNAATYQSAIKVAGMIEDFKICQPNYMGRTLLHEAAAAGNIQVVTLFMHACPYMLDTEDLMGATPLDDAKFFQHQEVIDFLVKWKLLKTGYLPNEEK